jgi:hypothetical protein
MHSKETMSHPSSNPISIDLRCPYLVHLSLLNYKRFRDGLLRPYDPMLIHSMIMTMNDLMLTFRAQTGYVNTTEIILVFTKNTYKKLGSRKDSGDRKDVRERNEIRPDILLTTYVSFATTRFNYYVVNNLYNENYTSKYTQSKLETLLFKQAMFEAEYLQGSGVADLSEYVVKDIHKFGHNSLSEFVHLVYPTVQTETMTIPQLHDLVRVVMDPPNFVVCGIFGKYENKGIVVNRTFPYNERIQISELLLAPTWTTPDNGFKTWPIVDKQMVYAPQYIYLQNQAQTPNQQIPRADEKQNETILGTLKRINTEVDTRMGRPILPAPNLASDSGNQNNTVSKVDAGSSVSNSDRC